MAYTRGKYSKRGSSDNAPPKVMKEEKYFPPSPQQSVIYDWITNGKGNALIEAVAGAGKTSTLLESLSYMKGTVAFAAYNKKIADEIDQKIGARLANGRINSYSVQPTAGTFHSFGFRAWRQSARGSVKLDYKKTANLMTELAIPPPYQEFVKKAYSLGKQMGIGALVPMTSQPAWDHIVTHFDLEDMLRPQDSFVSPFDSDDDTEYFNQDLTADEGIKHTIRMLVRSIELADTAIDFDDMIYMPLVMNIRLQQYDWVLIDEAQDSNPTRRELAKRMLSPISGRLIAVGDPAQAIYGFTGADSDSLDVITQEFHTVRLPLTITYRCPKAVVRLARTWVDHMEADPSAPEGEVTTETLDDLMTGDTADLRMRFHPNAAILCRNTKPLVELAFKLIARDVACHVEGKDIGYSLILLIDKFPRVRNLEVLSDKLRDHADRETEKLRGKGQEYRAEALNDRVDALCEIIKRMDPNNNVADLKKKINDLFADIEPGVPSPNMTLSTIHKSKGREWPLVYWLGRTKYQPSKYATQDWQKLQETNLMYVAATRSQGKLVEVQV